MSKDEEVRTVVGIHSCKEVLKVHPHRVLSLYLKQDWKDKKPLKVLGTLARACGVRVQVASPGWLNKRGEGHQGACLLVRGRPRLDIQSLLKKGRGGGHSAGRQEGVWDPPGPGGKVSPVLNNPALVYLDRVEDPRNLGAVLRSAWLLGAGGVLLPARGSVGLVASVMKAGAGAAEHVPVEFVSSPVHQIRTLKQAGFWVGGLDREGNKSLWDQELSHPTLFVVGSEAKGIRSTVKNLCDEVLHIPQATSQGNMNLSHAVVLALGEFVRQGRGR